MAIPMPIVQISGTRPAGNVARADSVVCMWIAGTVAKYADMEDCSPKPKADRRYGSKIDPYARIWWTSGWRPIVCCRRRHTSGACDRLLAETDYDGEYSTTMRYVHRWRRRTAACRIARGTCGSSGRRAACRSISAWPGPGSLARWRTCIARWSRCRIRTCGCAWRCRARTPSVCAMV